MPRGAHSKGRGITVLVGLPSRLGCQLLVTALKRSRHRFVVVASGVSSAEVVKAMAEHKPRVALLSVHLQDGPRTGLRVLRELHALYPKTRVILLLDASERDLVVEAFRGGASGVFSQNEPVEALFKCVESVCKGQVWANSHELQFILDALSQAAALPAADGKGMNTLTKREEGVVRLVAEGLTNREISRKLSLSEHTVKNYLCRIFEKLGISSRVELILYALREREQAALLNQ